VNIRIGRIEAPCFIVGDDSDCTEGFAGNMEGNEKRFLDARLDLREIFEVPVRPGHQLHFVGIQDSPARTEFTRGGAPDVRGVFASDNMQRKI
jgi:hypothetical protein